MVRSAVKNLTLEEFLKLPETKPASEYIDSEIIQKPMPQGKHSIIQAEFVTTINAIEILSPDQSQTKVVKKILHCLKNGTRMGWLVDPDDRSVIAYPPGKQPELFDEEQQLLPVPSLASGYQLTVGQLFSWLKL